MLLGCQHWYLICSFGYVWPVFVTSYAHSSRKKETVYSTWTNYIGIIPSRRPISIPVLALNWTKSRTNSNFRWKSERPQTRTIMRRFSGFGIKNSIRGETEPCEDGPPPRLSNQDFLRVSSVLRIFIPEGQYIIGMETFPVRQKDLDDGAKCAKASHPNSIGSGLYHAERIYTSPAASG